MNVESSLKLALLLAALITESASRSNCADNCSRCLPGGICTSCNIGWFGPSCKKSCPPSCSDGCHKTTQYCVSCTDNKYGNLCLKTCSPNCRSVPGQVCNRKDGYCTNGCKKGYFGGTCTSNCGHCHGGGCERASGHCEDGCIVGYRQPLCTDRCEPNCLNCTSSRCLQCTDSYTGPYCKKMASTSATEPDDASQDGVPEATVGIALGFTFTVIILLLIACLLLYTRLSTFCLSIFKAKRKDAGMSRQEPMFIEDKLGSPRISRSFLKLHEIGDKKNDSTK